MPEKPLGFKQTHTKKPSNNTTMQKAIGIVIVPPNGEGAWLSQRIAAKDFNGFHQTAGGGIEPGESAKEAAIRELLEETGIVAQPEHLLPLICKIYTKPSGERYQSTQFLLISSEIPENKEPHKHTDWCLIPWHKIKELNCFGAFKEFCAFQSINN